MVATRVPRTTTTLPPESLTPREEEAIEYVWQGLSNREIAERMVVGLKTVDAHIGNARRKLGFARDLNGRVALALWLERKKHADYRRSLGL